MQENNKNIVVTMRCIDMASPTDDVDKVKCDKCGEMTWISRSFREKKIDNVICQTCFSQNYNDKDFHVVVTEECIEEAINCIESLYGKRLTREEMLQTMEEKIGKKIQIKNI